jgi:hypothetical protein
MVNEMKWLSMNDFLNKKYRLEFLASHCDSSFFAKTNVECFLSSW